MANPYIDTGMLTNTPAGMLRAQATTVDTGSRMVNSSSITWLLHSAKSARREPGKKLQPTAFRLVKRRETAVGGTVILLHPALHVAGVAVRVERGCQQNERALADGAGG